MLLLELCRLDGVATRSWCLVRSSVAGCCRHSRGTYKMLGIGVPEIPSVIHLLAPVRRLLASTRVASEDGISSLSETNAHELRNDLLIGGVGGKVYYLLYARGTHGTA